MGLQIVWTVIEASSLALKEELMEKCPQNLSYLIRNPPQNKFESVGDKKKCEIIGDSNSGKKGANNSYGHISNVYRIRRVDVIAEEREEEEEREEPAVENDEYAEVEFMVEEYDKLDLVKFPIPPRVRAAAENMVGEIVVVNEAVKAKLEAIRQKIKADTDKHMRVKVFMWETM
ncbi:hypothetical protein KIW84_010548 [Lathyrus oleraceus]|uniref:Uncharacterized protein n=1 Tax=Pisum sativum TaxID=3888 RepID=A0A9D5B9X5_PEA|nr:hypothetical protein KIW84_010548 [Pisum sativum]